MNTSIPLRVLGFLSLPGLPPASAAELAESDLIAAVEAPLQIASGLACGCPLVAARCLMELPAINRFRLVNPAQPIRRSG